MTDEKLLVLSPEEAMQLRIELKLIEKFLTQGLATSAADKARVLNAWLEERIQKAIDQP